MNDGDKIYQGPVWTAGNANLRWSKASHWWALVAIAMLTAVAYWWWSPLLALRSMHDAVLKNDADAFNNFVDFPRVRNNLKGQFDQVLRRTVAENATGGAGAVSFTLGALLGGAIVDKIVDTIVTPEAVMRVMVDGAPALGTFDGGQAERARTAAAEADVNALNQALKLYRVDNGDYPTQEQGLQALMTMPTRPPFPRHFQAYIDRLPPDPWGRPYRYVRPGRRADFDVFFDHSQGRDPASRVSSDSPSVTTERKGADKLLVQIVPPANPSRPVTVVLERSGFSTWKVTEIRLPLLGR